MICATKQRGFSLIELTVAVAIMAVLAAIAYPSYRKHVVRGSREAVKTDLVELAALQEKIYLNSNAYTSSVTSTYNGTSGGGLGRTNGKSTDGKYALSVATGTQTFTITATPVAGTTQAGDGNLAITSDGGRTWGSVTW